VAAEESSGRELALRDCRPQPLGL